MSTVSSVFDMSINTELTICEAEMAADDDDFTMTAEEKAQMATSLPIARQLLSDLKPPLPDSAIFDSLWHYWFDVDKSVTWLRKDWEKKGEPSDSLDRSNVVSPFAMLHFSFELSLSVHFNFL